MPIICVDPRIDPLWQRLVEQQESSVFHSPGWMRALTETYGWEIQAYIAIDGLGEPQAGLPFCRIADPSGERIISLPFSDYCDPLVKFDAHWQDLIDHLLKETCRVVLRCLFNDLPLADKRFTLFKQAKWHGLDLQADLDTLWQDLPNPAKRAINKARREGIVVEIARQEESLRAFFEMHLKMRKYKYQLLAQPFRFFENIWRYLIEAQQGVLMTALREGEIIGGILFLEWKQGLYYKFNASLPAHLSHRPNDLLIWEGIKYAKMKDFTHLDFGLSDWDQAGLIQYKRKYANQEKTISFLQCLPDNLLSQPGPQIQSLLTQLTTLFTDEMVPDKVTERGGEVLYQFFA